MKQWSDGVLELGRDPLRPRIGVLPFPARYRDQLDPFPLGNELSQQLDQAVNAPSIGATLQPEEKLPEVIAIPAECFPGERLFTDQSSARKP